MNRRLLPALLLLAGCDGGGTPPAPRPGPRPGEAAAAEPVPVGPVVPRPPLPRKPADEAERVAGLIRLLEVGDTPLVEFAQEQLAAFPDAEAAARAMTAAAERNLVANTPFVQNILGSVKDEARARLFLPLYRKCFECEDPQVRRLAVAGYGQAEAEPDRALLARFAVDSWAPVQSAAFISFRRHPGPASAAALRGLLPRLQGFARAAACSVLGRMGDPASLPALRETLRAAKEAGEAEFPVWVGAAQGLALLGDEEGLEALRSFVRRLPLEQQPVPLDTDVSGWDGPEVILAAAKDETLRVRLLRQAREAGPGAAASAIRLLRTYPPQEDAIGAYLGALERKDWEPAIEALDALRVAGSPDATAKALAFLASPSADRRYAAALVLGRFRDPVTVKPLCERLAIEKDASVSRKICDALGLLGDPAAAPALLAFLRSDGAPSPDRALQAFEARQNMRGAIAAAAAPELARLVGSDACTAVRFHAARALGRAPRSAASRAALEALLRSPDASLRSAATEALGDLGDPATRDALCEAFSRETDDALATAQRDAILRIDLRNP